MDTTSIHRSIVVVDVEGYGDLARTTGHRVAVREGMYRVMRSAFANAGLPWDDRAVDDAGDSLILVLPADVRKLDLVDVLPGRVAAELRRHNSVHAPEARVRLRMVVHAGEIHHDERGMTGPDLLFACRLLEAGEAKPALRDSTATTVLVVSDAIYGSVVRQDAAAHPAEFRRIAVEVKETRTHAWIRLVDGHPTTPAPRAEPRELDLNALRPIVETLLSTPGFDSREARDTVLRELPFASVIPRLPTDRADTVSIVRTCRLYPGGLEALVEAVRFYAAGSVAMDRLDQLPAVPRTPCQTGVGWRVVRDWLVITRSAATRSTASVNSGSSHCQSTSFTCSQSRHDETRRAKVAEPSGVKR